MRRYAHISYEERVVVSSMRSRGEGVRAIARALGRSPGSISRELRVKRRGGFYTAKGATRITYEKRYYAKKGCLKVALSGEMSRFVKEKVETGWSPERIAGYLTRMGTQVSKKAVYRYIYSRSLERHLFWRKHRKRGGPKRRKAGTPRDGRRYIDVRPPVDGSGHYEADFIVSPRNTVSLLVVVDRYTRHTRVRKIPNRKHATVSRAFCDVFAGENVKSLTLDNDISFAHWGELEKMLHARVYFCHPYHSWEKGLVENTNRWIRVFVPKRRDIATVSGGEIRSIERWLNETPRQCLGFKTASEVVLQESDCSTCRVP